jgi:hypothetical protein
LTTNWLNVLNDLIVTGITTLGTLIATTIISPSNSGISITTANGRNLDINNGKGVNSGDVYFNSGSLNSNIYVTNGDVTISSGDLLVPNGVLSTTIISADTISTQYAQMREILHYPLTTSTAVKTNLIADANNVITSPSTYFGVWFIDAGVNDYKLDRFRFVPCSVAVAGGFDDYWVVCASYKVVLYRYANYGILAGQRPWSGNTDISSQTRTLDNTTGTGFLMIKSTDIYGASNQEGSCKVYYKNQEITMPYLS